jgi:hypothetical protein
MNQVVEEFFLKYTTEKLNWFKKMKEIKKSMNYMDWTKESRDISKQNKEIIECHILYFKDRRIGMPASVEEIIHEDMRIKKIKLCQKIKGKVGTVSAVELYCGEDGSMNGTVTGDKGKVNITTIIAGGYNIQCIHYRVLVK